MRLLLLATCLSFFLASAAHAAFTKEVPPAPAAQLIKALGGSSFATADGIFSLDCPREDSCSLKVDLTARPASGNDLSLEENRLTVSLFQNADAQALWEALNLPVASAGALQSKFFGTPDADVLLACRKKAASNEGNEAAPVFSCSVQIRLQ